MAAVLIAAAVLKGYQLATGPVPATGLYSSRVFLIALVELEWLFGVWLLTGLCPKWSWRVALGSFGVFACVSLYKGLAGDASCGCFGRVEVSPWYTLALDLGVVLCLLLWPPRELGDEPVRADPKQLLGFSRVGVVLAVAIFVGMPAALAMATYRPATLGDGGMIVGPGNVVVLDPEKWVGKQFSLLKHIEIDVDLASGSWVVVLYRRECLACDEFTAALARKYNRPKLPGLPRRFAFVEVPPCLSQTYLPVLVSAECRVGRLGDQHRWFVSTPVVALLEDGNVVEVPNGSDPNDLCEFLVTTEGV